MLFSSMAFSQVSTWDGTWEPWTHGTGTEADPFLIENARQLAYLAYRVNNGLDAGGGHVSNHDYHYKLMVDVDLNGSEDFQWTPIGYWNSDTDYQCFGGQFDGNGHKVSKLYITSNANRVGFYGYTDGATIQDISISGDTIATTGNYAGGIIGVANGLTIIKNCNNGTNVYVRCHPAYSGGLVGYTPSTIYITNCSNNGDIKSSCTVSNGSCVSGGILGCHDQYYTNVCLLNCYNSGHISSWTSYGYGVSSGIVGSTYSYDSNISCCYNVGVLGENNKYGIAGGRGIVVNSYYLNTCGASSSGEPQTETFMKSLEFVDVLNNGSCAWEQDVRPYQNQGYPILTGIAVSALTSDATNVTQSHATLHGTIEVANTSVQSQGFEYRKLSDSRFHTVNVPGNGSISTTLSGLIPNEQYVFRVFCNIADCGTYYGEEKNFTTLPVTVTTLNASDVTASSATLRGSMDIVDATLVSRGFEYCITGSPNYTTIHVDGITNIYTEQLSGLQANSTYEYRAFLNIAESPTTYYGETKTFFVSWLNQDTIYINDADMLHWVADQCNSGTTFQGKCIMLMNDIVLPENVPNNMISIGSYPDRPFKGTFDGNGKLITNLYIDQPNTPYQGFFGYTLNANLYNVGLVNITASGRNYTGGMVAYAKNTHLRDCYVNGGTLFALSYCGGLIGYQEQGTNSIVSGCYNTCSVNGNHYVGGLIGFSNYSTVRNSYVAGRVSGQGNGIGAIIGGANEVLMYYCYFSTELTGQTNAIGENNFKDGGEGLTNAQMRDPQFVNTLNQNLMTPVWMADYANHINNGFPIIKWQRPGTGMEEHEAAKSCISLFPNPAKGFVTIQSDDSSVTLKHMEVYDVMGRKVMSKVLDGQSQMFSIDKLHAGVYHVRVQIDNGHYTNIKLVVQ